MTDTNTAAADTGWMQEHAANHATGIVAAALAANVVRAEGITDLYRSSYQTVMDCFSGATVQGEAVIEIAKPTPAEVKKSVKPAAITSFIDGKAYKTLKRHLRLHGYSPESYRATFGLPADYPIVAADYSAQRSKLAREIGLGQRGASEDEAPTAA